MGHIDCGSCPNITDGCRGICEKIQLQVPRWSANWHMQEFYESKFGTHVRADDYYIAQTELAALREELATSNKVGTAIGETLGRVTAERDDLHKRLTAAEQRNAVMSKLLQRCIPVCRYKGSHTERQLINEIDAALKPTESGASE